MTSLAVITEVTTASTVTVLSTSGDSAPSPWISEIRTTSPGSVIVKSKVTESSAAGVAASATVASTE